jgi:transglutaminase-like putative cysteine protease
MLPLPSGGMLLQILHRTTFCYAGPAHDSFNEARLRPVDDGSQTCQNFSLRTDPAAPSRAYRDLYGNMVHYFDVVTSHRRLTVEAQSEVTTVPNPARLAVPEVPASAIETSGEREMLAEFFTDTAYVPLDAELWREAQDALAGGRSDLWSDICTIGRHISNRFEYRPAATGVHTRATDALKLRAGVCQDFAHIMLGMCRTMGIPARYVSGYFHNPRRRPNEIEASHAWVEAFVPGYGWAAFDPTHDRPADEKYVKVAVGRDYGDIRPVSGTYRGAPTRELQVVVNVKEAAPAGAAG